MKWRIVTLCALLLVWPALAGWGAGPNAAGHGPVAVPGDDPMPTPLATERELTEEERAELWRAVELSKKVWTLHDEGDYQEAMPLAREALEIREKVLGPDHPEVATSLRLLGFLFMSTKDWAGATPFYGRALAIQEKALGQEDANTLQSIEDLGYLRYRTGDLQGARQCCERALAIREKMVGPEHADISACLTKLGFVLEAMGDKVALRQVYERMLAIREKVLGPDHKDTIETLDSLCALLLGMGELEAALPCYERAVATHVRVQGPAHPDGLISQRSLGYLLHRSGNSHGALPYYQRGLAICEQVLSPDDPLLAMSLVDVGLLLQTIGDLPGALQHLERALAIREKTLGPEDPATLESLKHLASLLQEMGDLDSAKPYYERILAINEKVFGREHPDLVSSLTDLATVLQELGDSAGALPYFERCLAILEKMLGPEDPVTAMAHGVVGAVLRDMGDLPGSRPHLEHCLETTEKVEGADHPSTALSLGNLGLLLQDMGDLPGALSCQERALAIFEKVQGGNHLNTASAHNSLGVLLQEMGDVRNARPHLERSLAIREKALGPEHPDTATSLSNLGNLLQVIGDLAGAKLHFGRSLSIHEKVLGLEHPATAVSQNDMGVLLFLMGDPEAARPYIERALTIRENVLGLEHPDTSESLSNLGFLLNSMGDHSAARPYYERSLAIAQNSLGPEHPTTAASLNNLGMLLNQMGELSDARQYIEHSVAIWERVLGMGHPQTAAGLENLGFIHWRLGDKAEARRRVEAGFAGTQKSMQSLLAATSERERMLVVESRRSSLDAFLSLFDRRDDARATHSVVLRWKGVVAESLIAERTTVLGSREPELSELFEGLTEIRGELATAIFATPVTAEERERRSARLSQLTVEKERLERELAKKSSVFAQEQGIVAAGSADLCARLPVGTALLDYLRYARFDVPEGGGDVLQTPSYVAFVLLGGACDTPIRVELGEAVPLEEAVFHYRQLIDTNAPPARVNATAQRIRKLVWDPVAAHFGGRTQVWVVPDAALAGVPFGALVDDDGKYLIEQYHLGFLSSGQQLLRLALKERRTASGALVAGGIDYDAGGGGPTAEASAAATRAAPAVGSGLFPLGPLSATGPEAEAVARELGDSNVALLTGVDATEPRIKYDAPGRRIIHLATHGFFATGKVRSALEGDDSTHRAGPGALGMIGQRQVIGFNPMVLSGVILAGANVRAAEQLTRGDDDGVLTAEEVAGLDLRGTELVVLSACETGLGEVKSGEGVLGLRRAFAFAGARALVMSLWKVPDQETMELMKAFYAKVKADPGLDKGDAMRAAQLELIEHLRQRDGMADPRLWAAWVVSGR